MHRRGLAFRDTRVPASTRDPVTNPGPSAHPGPSYIRDHATVLGRAEIVDLWAGRPKNRALKTQAYSPDHATSPGTQVVREFEGGPKLLEFI